MTSGRKEGDLFILIRLILKAKLREDPLTH